MLARHRKLIAVAYWIFTALVYIVGLYQSNNEGGIPTVVVTLPWSILVLGAGVFHEYEKQMLVVKLRGSRQRTN